jgi:tRNA 2-selenouridine synthase
LNKTDFWLEDESQRIGRVNIPHPLWHTIRKAPVYFIDIPFHERLAFIEKNYGVLETEKLIEAVTRIQKRLGPLETKTTIQLLNENQVKEAFSILLKYYDKTYLKSLHTRDNSTANIHSIIMDSTNPEDNKTKLIAYLKNKNDRAESIG